MFSNITIHLSSRKVSGIKEDYIDIQFNDDIRFRIDGYVHTVQTADI